MDTRDTRVQNLLFLLAAAPLGVGCVITGDDGDTEATPTTTTPTTDATAGETDPTAGTTVTPSDSTTMTPSDTTETPADSTTLPPEDTTEGPDDTTTGGTVPASCAAYADLVTMCYDEKAGATTAMYCAETLAYYEMNYGAECVTAYEDYLACLSALTCKMLTGKDPLCEEEFMMVETICVVK
jgi:hypothetical protein